MEHDDYEQLERIREELKARHDAWYAEFDRARGESRERHAELVAGHELLIAEFEQLRRQHKGRFDKVDTDMESSRRANREMLLVQREIMHEARDIRHGVQTSIEGLLRVLDELRRDDGPSPAGA